MNEPADPAEEIRSALASVRIVRSPRARQVYVLYLANQWLSALNGPLAEQYNHRVADRLRTFLAPDFALTVTDLRHVHADDREGDDYRFSLSGLALRYLVERAQSQRAAERVVLANASAGTPFGVYLRSFGLGGRFVNHENRGSSYVVHSFQDGSVQELVTAAAGALPLVCVANPASPHPAIPSLSLADEGWQAVVTKLVAAATLVVLYVDDLTQGVSAEIEILRRLGKQNATLLVIAEKDEAEARTLAAFQNALLTFEQAQGKTLDGVAVDEALATTGSDPAPGQVMALKLDGSTLRDFPHQVPSDRLDRASVEHLMERSRTTPTSKLPETFSIPTPPGTDRRVAGAAHAAFIHQAERLTAAFQHFLAEDVLYLALGLAFELQDADRVARTAVELGRLQADILDKPSFLARELRAGRSFELAAELHRQGLLSSATDGLLAELGLLHLGLSESPGRCLEQALALRPEVDAHGVPATHFALADLEFRCQRALGDEAAAKRAEQLAARIYLNQFPVDAVALTRRSGLLRVTRRALEEGGLAQASALLDHLGESGDFAEDCAPLRELVARSAPVRRWVASLARVDERSELFRLVAHLSTSDDRDKTPAAHYGYLSHLYRLGKELGDPSAVALGLQQLAALRASRKQWRATARLVALGLAGAPHSSEEAALLVPLFVAQRALHELEPAVATLARLARILERLGYPAEARGCLLRALRMWKDELKRPERGLELDLNIDEHAPEAEMGPLLRGALTAARIGACSAETLLDEGRWLTDERAGQGAARRTRR